VTARPARMRTAHRQERRLLSNRWRIAFAIVLAALLLFAPTVLVERAIFTYHLSEAQLLGIGLPQVNLALIAIMGAVALSLLVGYTGLISLGHAAFFAVGALVAGVLGTQWALPFPLVLLGAGIVGALAGTIVGLPSLRLRGLYLMLATLALHFIVLYVFLRYMLANFGAAGIPFDVPTIGPLAIDSDERWYFLLLAFTVATLLATRNLLRMRQGRSFVAVRDHDIAAAALGMHVAVVRLKAFAVSSFIVSVVGALYAYNLGNATSTNYTLTLVIGYFAMILIGGMGSILGAVLGALLWQLLPQVLDTLSTEVDPATPVVGDLLDKYQQQTVALILGVLIILMLRFRPDGLNGIWLTAKRAVIRWPYSS
jgi:branched-chain amino acid transport system permease protein